MKTPLEKPPSFGQVLRRLRIAAGLSQEALAERASMSANGVSALERGANQAPQRDTLALLIQALQLNGEQAAALTRSAVRPSQPRDVSRRRAQPEALPLPVTPLFGRERDIDDVTQLLSSAALVTLTGPGGIGKTRLALHVAQQLVPAFPDGVRFIDLARVTDGSLVARALAAQFGIKERHDEPVAQTIAHELQAKKVLAIVDNCEHVLDAAASLAEALIRICPNVRILATSRQSLNVPGEHVYRVSALAAEAAVQLFAERATRAVGSFSLTEENVETVKRIVRHLDNIALAIELAAARTNVLTLDQLETRLSKRFQILTGGSAAVEPRQQTMRTAIDWSYDLLDAEERRLFRRLSVFTNGFSLDAVLRVCEDDASDEGTTFESLSCLVDKSLVVSDNIENIHRFRLLETIRAYAADKADESGEKTLLQRRHAAYFAAVAEAAECGFTSSDSTGGWIRGLEPDLDNFRAAVDFSLERGGDTRLGVELLTTLQEFWIAQGFAQDISRRARAILDAPAELSDAQRAALWLALARTRQELFAHPRDMLEAADKARTLYEQIGDRGGLALALRQYGTALMRLGQFAEAEEQLRRSVDLYRETRDDRMVVRGLGYLATLLQMRGEHERARSALLDVLAMAGELGDERMIPTTSMNVAETEFALGDVESAAVRAKENLNNDSLQKSPEMRATQSANLAVYLFALGKISEARRAALEAIRFSSGSFVAVPLQHIAAMLAPIEPKRAARLLGYVEAVFASTAFSRQYTEHFTYRVLISTLHDALDEASLAEYMREGESMSDKNAIRLAFAPF